MHDCRLNASGGLPYMGDVCVRCYGGELSPHGPVCTPGNQRQSWVQCGGCGNITDLQTHPCNDDGCDVHGCSTR